MRDGRSDLPQSSKSQWHLQRDQNGKFISITELHTDLANSSALSSYTLIWMHAEHNIQVHNLSLSVFSAFTMPSDQNCDWYRKRFRRILNQGKSFHKLHINVWRCTTKWNKINKLTFNVIHEHEFYAKIVELKKWILYHDG